MSHSLTYNDTLGAYAPYPAPIRPYLLRAETHPLLRSLLTKSFMRVFIDILGRAPIADPLHPLKVRMDVVADDLAVSTKTVSRAIHFMQQKGWLNQDDRHDGRNTHGKFSAREFLLGMELRRMLGLPTEAPCQNPPQPEQEKSSVGHPVSGTGTASDQVHNSSLGTKMSGGLYIGVNKVFKKEASFNGEASQLKTQKNNPENPAATGVSQTTPQEPPKHPRLPADLKEMAAILNIHPSGICSLMRIAKQANQRLQDVWKVKRDQLMNAGAREGRAFHYIRFLLNTGEDFAFRAHNMVTGKAGPGRAVTARVPGHGDAVDFRHYLNKKYAGANGLLVRIHGDGSAEIRSATRNPSYICPRDMPPVYEAIRNNKLWLVQE